MRFKRPLTPLALAPGLSAGGLPAQALDVSPGAPRNTASLAKAAMARP